MAQTTRSERSRRGRRRHRVAALVGAGTASFELGVASEVFGDDRSGDFGVPWYEFKVCHVGAEPIRAYGGLELRAGYGLEELDRADTIVIPPVDEREHHDGLLDALIRANGRGARLVSLCTGAFVLAATGLLDGRRATTHWRYAAELARRYPEIEVDPAVLYVDDGDILTSAGTAAGIDVCLHIVRTDFGADVANQLARRMVVPPHRDGGQAQYVDHPIDVLPGRDLFSETLTWAESHLAEPITVEELARRSAMSPRTFARRFAANTGTTPHHWITHQRVQLAQRMLESTEQSIDYIASATGLGSATNLRNHFQRIVKTTPTQYRRTFRRPESA